MRPVLNEVIGPDMIGILRSEPDARSVIEPETALLFLLRWDFQPFTSPDPLDPLVVYVPARVAQQTGDYPISVSPVLAGEFDNVFGQLLLVGRAAWNLALRGAMLPENAAGPALRYANGLPHLVNAPASARRAQKFPPAASVRINLSKVKSETALRRRWFSFSSSLSRFN